MSENVPKQLTWRGKETVEAVLANLEAPARIEIKLPANYNHALFVHLMADAPPGQAEQLNLEGDVAILREVYRIKGLEEFASLIGPLTRLSARVQVISPPTIVIILE